MDFVENRIVLSTDAFSTKPLWYAVYTHKATGNYAFAAASYESVLVSMGIDVADYSMMAPNEVIELDAQSFVLRGSSEYFPFDLRQHKTHTRDWIAAFEDSVRIRTHGLRHRVFVGLSVGPVPPLWRPHPVSFRR